MKKYLLLTLCLFLLPFSADAATVSVVVPDTVNVGDVFTAEIFLDTEGESINALEGTIIFPGTLNISEVRYGGSVVSLWLSQPAERSSGVIDFAGVIPGGYQASPERTGRGNLFTLVFSGKEPGAAQISFGSDTGVYLNDGEGTKLPASKGGSEVEVVVSGAPVTGTLGKDIYPPEVFTPELVSGNPYALQGDVLVFATQDKDSGVSRYDVGFSSFGFLPEGLVSWTSAESPYPVSQKIAEKYVFVRAIDGAGNVRVAKLPPASPGALTVLFTWVFPALLIGFLLFLGIRLILMRHKVSLK